jgi:hypothetical protein
MEHEWDNFIIGGMRVRSRPHHRTIEYQPSGWSSPVTRKVVNAYWRVTITIIKMLISIPLAMIAIAAFWLLWVIVTLRFN